tara:strand:+ start:360 stop:608 length:249 start_codon:yes stop_codon:yes gene_type:complete
MNLTDRSLPIIEKKPPRTKVKVSPSMLPMLATICPVQIVGSEQSEGLVVLVLEGAGCPKAEWSTIHCENERGKTTVTIKAQN